MKPLWSSPAVVIAAATTAASGEAAHHHHHDHHGVSPPALPRLPAEWVAGMVPRGGAAGKDPDQSSSSSSSASGKKPKKQSKADAKPPKTNKNTKKKPSARKNAAPSSSSSSDRESSSSSSSSSSTKTTMPIVQEILDCQEDYYKVLGLDSSQKAGITEKQIRKAYRKRAVQTHPDKTGGDRRAFDIVARAYEVLGDDQQKAVYDRFGKAGVDGQAPGGSGGMGGFGGMGGASSFQDVFQNMFQQQQRQQQSLNRTVRYQIEVSLEDLYAGVTREILVRPPSRRRPQPPPPKAAAPKRVEVEIPRGALPGQSILVSGAMDWDPSETPGDLVLVVSPKPHPVFTRKSYDLAMELTITLEEALCGVVARPIQHLDGTEILLESASLPTTTTKEGEGEDDDRTPIPIRSGDVQVLKGRGFPKSPRGDDFGDLYIQFRVEMPGGGSNRRRGAPATPVLDRLTPDEREQLSVLLAKLQGGRKQPQRRKPGKGIRRLEAAVPSDFGRASGTARVEPDAEHSHYFGGGDDEGFGGGTSTFFSRSFGGGGGDGARSFFFGPGGMPGGNPFQQAGSSGEDGNVECQQM